ncbi:MAG: hypothetical protein AB7H86_15995 [Blastocatellales bacterium]
MNATVNPEMRELQQKVEEMRINLARTQGEIEIIRHNSERNDRQTMRQFVIFTVTMLITVATTLIGTSVFQTDALRREMTARFEMVDQRMTTLDKRMDRLEERMDRMEQRMDRMEQRMDRMDKRLDEIARSLDAVKSGLGVRNR